MANSRTATPVRVSSGSVPFVDLQRVHTEIEGRLTDAYRRVLNANSFIQRDEVEAFENEWSEYCGVPHTIGCANGTDALMLILLALKIGLGDEVITVSNTFFATVEAIASVGAMPVIVDAALSDGLIDVVQVKSAITANTKAILAVHLYGQPCDVAALKQLSEDHNIALIEDAAQAHGATFKGSHVGRFGIAAAFSFFPGKNLGALGDAGAVVTGDEGLAETIRSLRNHGRERGEKYAHQRIGYNMRMDEMQAAFLRAKLPFLPQWIEDRRSVAAIYNEAFAGLKEVTLFTCPPEALHSYHLYVVRHDKRDELAKSLASADISTGIHYPLGCHEQPAWRERQHLSLRNTETICRTCLSLPIFGRMTEQEAHRVAEAVLRFVT